MPDRCCYSVNYFQPLTVVRVCNPGIPKLSHQLRSRVRVCSGGRCWRDQGDMSVPATQSRQVAESSFEFLHIEMVDYVKRQCTLAWTENKENKASDVKLLQAYELLAVVAVLTRLAGKSATSSKIWASASASGSLSGALFLACHPT